MLKSKNDVWYPFYGNLLPSQDVDIWHVPLASATTAHGFNLRVPRRRVWLVNPAGTDRSHWTYQHICYKNACVACRLVNVIGGLSLNCFSSSNGIKYVWYCIVLTICIRLVSVVSDFVQNLFPGREQRQSGTAKALRQHLIQTLSLCQ